MNKKWIFSTALTLSLISFSGIVKAACVLAGFTVTCTGTDANGYSSGGTSGLLVNIDPGAFVLQSGAGAAIALNNGNIITNNGTVAPGIPARNALTMVVNNILINNSTGIFSSDAFDTILVSGNTGTITNNGLMSLINSAGQSVIQLNGGSIDVINNLTISASGATAYGITSAATDNTITNNGTVTATTGAIRLSATANNNTTTNNGIMTASIGIDASATTGGTTNTFINTAGATLTGSTLAIDGGTGNMIIQNSGIISGIIDLEGGDDQVTLFGTSTTTGNIDLGSGIDRFTIKTGAVFSGNIDGQGGNNIFILNGTGTGAYNGNITSFTTFSKDDTGVWNLGGTINLGGGSTANINAGTLNINGTLTAVTTNINAGGTLGGSGTIAGSLTNTNGIINPGNSIGTLNVTGGYTQGAAGTLQIEVGATSGSNDTLNITGGVTSIAGTLDIVQQSSVYTTGSTYNILTAAAAYTGAFSTINNATINLFRQFVVNYLPTTIQLEVQGSYASAGQTDNQKSVGAYLDNTYTTASGDYQTIINALDSLSTMEEGLNAFDQLTGDMHASLSTISQDIGDRFVKDIGARFDIHRFDVKGDEGRNGWYKYSNQNGKAEELSNNTDFNVENTQNTVGAEYTFKNKGILGVAIGVSKADARFTNTGNAEMNSYEAGMYGSYLFSNIYVDTTLAYMKNNYETQRNISFGSINRQTHGDYDSQEWLIHSETGYIIPIQNAKLIPNIGLQYSILERDPFTETGGDSISLESEKRQMNSLKPSIGLKLNTTYNVNDAVISPQIYTKYEYETMDDKETLKMKFEGQPSAQSFDITGIESKNSLSIGGAIKAILNDRLDAFLSYENIFKTDQQERTSTLGLKLKL